MLNSPYGDGGLLPSLQPHEGLSLGQSQRCTITNNPYGCPKPPVLLTRPNLGKWDSSTDRLGHYLVAAITNKSLRNHCQMQADLIWVAYQSGVKKINNKSCLWNKSMLEWVGICENT